MSWYKFANRIDKIKKWLKQHEEDGAEVWVRSNEVFVSIGDWGDRDIIGDLEDILGGIDIEFDYEVGSPGYDWKKVE